MLRLVLAFTINAYCLFLLVHEQKEKICQLKEPRAGDLRKVEIDVDVIMEFCWIPPGECQLGASIKENYLDDEFESNRSKFKTKGFWLSKYTVTQEEWKVVMGNNPSEYDGRKDNKVKGMKTSRFPVENVSWDDCQLFLEKINKLKAFAIVFGMAGKLRLPHEDEWEYSYRRGKGNKQSFYWGECLNGTEANCDGQCPLGTVVKGQFLGRPCSVDFDNDGRYERHPWGLCHMSGNVWQMCDNFYANTRVRVIRGGAWCSNARMCRGATRFLFKHIDTDVGFRLCLSSQ